MCGIAGIAGRPDRRALERMLLETRHRGPDDSGVYVDDVVSVGMNRLSILDLSPAGHQPMLSPDNRHVLVYNGEMYNFREQREKLAALGHSFRSNTDTEVVLALYRQYGKACLDHMRGMFAFAIWDTQTRQLFAARDHLGIKPFVYWLDGPQLVFCSELKGLMAHGAISKTLDRASVTEYLVAGHINQPRTIFSRVKALLPGHYLVWKSGEISIRPYWSPVDARHASPQRYEDAVATTRQLVLQSVAEELVSDVPLGVFLSGGIDSSVVVAAMKAAGAPRIQTYSVGFAGEHDALDETGEALESARFFGTEHCSVDITSRDVERQFEDMVRAFDQPVVDAYNTYLVSKHARTGVTVALSGLGGDEVFGGYHQYKTMLRRALDPKPMAGIARGTRLIWEHLPISEPRRIQLHEAAARATIPGHYSVLWRVFTPTQAAALLNGSNASTTSAAIYHETIRANEVLDDPTLEDPFQRIGLIGMRSFMMHRLLRDSDAVSMSHSLEIRVPLIDKRIIEYVFPLPWDMKFRRDYVLADDSKKGYADGGVKRILVDAFMDLLPPGIASRKKRGFSMPMKTWLEKAFEDRIRSTFEGEDGRRFNTAGLPRFLDVWRQRKSNPMQIWSILVLVEWLRQMNVSGLDVAD